MKIMRIITTVCMLLVIFASCTSNDPGLVRRDLESTADSVGLGNKAGGTGLSSTDTEGKGYLYGRFFMSTALQPGSWEATAEDPKMYGIVIRNVETRESFIFTFEDFAAGTTQLAVVPAGTYQMEALRQLYQSGGEIRPIVDGADYRIGVSDEEKAEIEAAEAADDDYTLLETFNSAMDGYAREFTVEENTAVYLGDFVLNYYLYVLNGGNIVYYYYNTQTFPPLDRVDETTKSLHARYPYMNDSDIMYTSHMDNVTRYLPWDNFFTVYDYTGEVVKRTQ